MYKIEFNNLRLFFSGKIDSSTVKNTEEECLKAFSESNCKNIIIDACDLQYISSAGLRLILKIKKEHSNTQIMNVSPEVYEIFEMTGFTEMLPIKKAFRKISLEGAQKIGEGAVGKIFKITDDTIVKLFKSGDLSDIERERKLAKKAFILGIPTYISFDTVIADGKYASVFELINATALSKLYKTHWENRDEYNQMTINLMKKIHAVTSNDPIFIQIPNKYSDYVSLSPIFSREERLKLYDIIASIPDSNGLIHGDIHFNNIMIHDDEITVIDMDSVAIGNPVYEHAALFMSYIAFNEADKDDALTFHGLEAEKLEEIFYGIFNGYYSDKTECEKTELLKQIKLLGYLTVVMYTEDEPTKAVTFKHCLDQVKKLIAE